MASTKLNKEQQIITRLFIERVLSLGQLDNDPARVKSAVQFCYNLLGYQVLPNGHAIDMGKEVKTTYGAGLHGNAYDEYEDQYIPDGKALGYYSLEYGPRPCEPSESD